MTTKTLEKPKAVSKLKKSPNKKAYYGLINGRIAWNMAENRKCITLADWGFAMDTIASETGLTRSQVIYRLRCKGLKLSDYRKGDSKKAQVILNRFHVEHQKT